MKEGKKKKKPVVDSGRVEDALELGSLHEGFLRFELFLNSFQELEKAFLLQMGRFNTLERERQLGNLESQYITIQENQIRHSFLLELDAFKKELSHFLDLSQPELLLRGAKEQETLALDVMKARLRGYYEVEDLIRDGNSALVFKLSDIFTKRKAVAKVLKVPKLGDDIRMEIGKVAQLKHRNLIKLYSAWLNSFPFYVICEYVDGEVLSNIVSNGNPCPQAQAVEWLCDLCDVLQYLNQKDIAHPCIRPSKIFIDYEFHPMLSPFDIIKASNDDRTMGKFMEECQYLSPEFMEKEVETAGEKGMGTLERRAMKSSDQFALGLIAYKLLTGNELFSGKSVQQVIKNRIDFFGTQVDSLIKVGDNPFRDDLLAKLPSPAWIELVGKTLQPKPENRYGDLHILLERLQEIKADIRRDQSIVARCYDQCLKTDSDLINQFYKNLFHKLPRLETHFKGMDVAKQRYMFHMAIDMLLDPTKQSNLLQEKLQDKTHSKFDEAQYTVFLDTFIETIRDIHQDYGYQWGKDEMDAWETVKNHSLSLIRQKVAQ